MKKGELKARVKAALAKKKAQRTATLVKSKSRNPVEYFSRRSKIFSPLATNFGVRMPFTSDPVWDPINATGQSTLEGAKTAYLMLNLTNMSLLTGQNPNAYWHSTSHLAMCQVYQEFLYQTTYLSLDMVMDSIIREPTRPSIQQVQTVAKIVPLSQLRKVIFPIVGQPPITNQLTPINSGILYTGIDYYGMLTSQPGARQSILTADGNRGGMRMSFKVDAFEHNGTPIKVANTVRNTTDTNAGTISPDVLQLWAQPSYDNLNIEDQQVLLVAFRWTSNSPDNTFLIRANLKCDQHWVYSDPHTPAQNLVYDPAILGPDGR